MALLYSKKVVIDHNLCERIKRTWKERLFSKPWKPLKKWNIKPDTGIYQTATSFIMHPIMFEKLKEAVK